MLVNAPTSPALCGILGICAQPEGRIILVQNVAGRAEQEAKDLLKTISLDQREMSSCAIGLVNKMISEVMHTIKHHLPGHHDDHDEHAHGRVHDLAHSVGDGIHKLNSATDKMTGGMIHESNTLVVKKAGGLYGLLQGAAAEKLVAPDIDLLWKKFDEARDKMLSTAPGLGGQFQIGDKLPTIRKILKEKKPDPEKLQIVREIFLEVVRTSYWEQIQEDRFLPGSPEPEMLLNSLDVAKESSGKSLIDFEVLSKELKIAIANGSTVDDETQKPQVEQQGMIQKWLEEQRIKKNLQQQTSAILMTTSFISAHLYAQTKIASYFGEGRNIDSPEEAYLIAESQIECFMAAAARAQIGKKAQVKVNTMWETMRIIEGYRSSVMTAHSSGVVGAKDADAILHPIAHAVHHLHAHRAQLFDSPEGRRQLDIAVKGKEVHIPVNKDDAVVKMQGHARVFIEDLHTRKDKAGCPYTESLNKNNKSKNQPAATNPGTVDAKPA
eukprot:gnl/TRDRNA2_/TRDRNA2_139616_c2_seq1.p1 gnl/TRDRNA2_/TRDRNA2_139616_c2~~gnl/TRDRNA2_/TRDRNA2_139616_c2_seq1.p1  ORF type:complete len:519 (-),score=132.27 gnl/TRDRNA2_/TRDRNA2_139616_c2_seq1:145-1629(-)